MVRAHFCSLPQRRSAAVYLFSAVQFSCPNAPRLPPPVHDLPSQDIRPNGCCSPHGVSAALVTSLRLQCRPQRVLPLFLQNCRLTVSGRYGAQPHVVTEHVIHLSVRRLPNHLYYIRLSVSCQRRRSPKAAKTREKTGQGRTCRASLSCFQEGNFPLLPHNMCAHSARYFSATALIPATPERITFSSNTILPLCRDTMCSPCPRRSS